MEDYAFTIKFNTLEKKNCTPSDYRQVFVRWLLTDERVKIDTHVYEQDSKGVCHSHGIISLPKGYYRKQLMEKGLHLKLEKIVDRAGWLAYIRKHQKAQPMFPVRAVGKPEVAGRSDQDDSLPDHDSDIEIDTNDNELFKKINYKMF